MVMSEICLQDDFQFDLKLGRNISNDFSCFSQSIANQLASKVLGNLDNLSFISTYEPCEYFLLESGNNVL